MKKNTTKVIKEANKYLVMQCIQAFEPVTLEKIAEKTLLSRPTILEIINSFKEEGIVVNGGFRESTGGRPPQLLCINGDSAYAIGIDFEFPTIRIALANAKREIVGRRKILFKIDTQAKEVLARMLRELEHLLEEFSSVRPRIVGIGVGICGTIRKTEGRSLHITRIRGWEHVELQRILQEKFHLPVYVNNDVHLLALVEKKKYMREDNSDFVYIGIRSGIGSAYMYQNKLMDGVQGNAGYIGHTVLNAEGPMCVCGNRGCLDAYAGELVLYNAGFYEAVPKWGCSQPENFKGCCFLSRDHDFEPDQDIGTQNGADCKL